MDLATAVSNTVHQMLAGAELTGAAAKAASSTAAGHGSPAVVTPPARLEEAQAAAHSATMTSPDSPYAGRAGAQLRIRTKALEFRTGIRSTQAMVESLNLKLDQLAAAQRHTQGG